MREILFRGKCEDNGEWVEGSLVHISNYCAIIQHDQDNLSVFDQVYLDCKLGTIDGMGTIVIPETVGQYTGLKDKNGKKIFEGDVLRTDLLNELSSVIFNDRCATFQVLFNDGYSEGFIERFSDIAHMEIIGNIHDNSELLGDKRGEKL